MCFITALIQLKDICQLNGNNNSVDIKHPALLTVSRISEVDAYKGHETVIRAIAKVRQQIPGVHYYVAGRGDLLPSLKNLARDLKVEEAVHFLGYVDDSVLSAIYSQCDVFVMPSKKEGFGLVFAEAMAHGKPCIAGNQDASPEVVRHNQTGLIVEPRNVDQIADAILTLISDDELRNKFGAKGKQLVTEEFSFDAFQGQMIEYLKPLYPTKIR